MSAKKTSFGFILSLSLLACGGSAEAMAKKPTPEVKHPSAVTILGSDDYQSGYELGHRNGSLISRRLRDATLGLEGCSALRQYQNGLLNVARKIQPPRGTGHGKEIAKGFFRGYLDSVRASIEDARHGCSSVAFDHGDFAGELYGSLLCNVATTSLEAYLELESTPLYANWAGGSHEVQNQCLVKAKLTLSECGTDLHEVQSTTDLHLNVSCSN